MAKKKLADGGTATTATAPKPVLNPAGRAMPSQAQANFSNAPKQTGLARAAAMSGRTFANGGKVTGKGKVFKSKVVSSGKGVGFPKSNTPAGKTGTGVRKG